MFIRVYDSTAYTMTEINRPEYPENSVLRHMMIDIYASKKTHEVWILHAPQFDPDIIKFEFTAKTALLTFVFEDGEKKDLGAPLRDVLVTSFKQVEEASLFLVDMDTKKVIGGKVVPIEHIGPDDDDGKEREISEDDVDVLSQKFGLRSGD